VAASLLSRLARAGVNFALGLRATEVHPGFSTRDRLTVLTEGVEPDVQGCIRRHVRPGMTVVDVGANIGLLARHLARAVGPGGQVAAFEPDPANFAALRANLARFPQAVAVMAAISDQPGRFPFFLHPSSSAGNSLAQIAGAARVDVECLPLDAYLAQAGLARLDLVKLDVEGAEIAALRGMHGALAAHPEAGLLVEFAPANQRAAGHDAAALYDAIRAVRPGLAVLDGAGAGHRVDSLPALLGRLNRHGYANLYCTAAG
jgi:FkbM family methyltransferase